MKLLKKLVVSSLIVFLVSGVVTSPATAVDALQINGKLPLVVDGNTSIPTFELALPPSVTLSSNSVVKWSNTEPTFVNEVGDTYSPNKDMYGSTSPFSIKITNLGRRANIQWGSGLSVKATSVFSATVDGKTYNLPVVVDFQKSTSPNVYRKELPKLPDNFKIEIENPNPGSDAQTLLRARFIWSGNWPHIAAQLGWADKSRFLVEPLRNKSMNNGEWTQFNVSVDRYNQKGFQLFATWQIEVNDSIGGVGISFSRFIPVNIDFKAKPTPIKEFTWSVNGETDGPKPSWTFKEYYSSSTINFTANIDWSKIDSSITCVKANWSLQYLVGNKWVAQDTFDFESAIYGDICRNWESGPIKGDLHIDAYANGGAFVKGTRSYRIWSEYLNKAVGSFKINFIPDKSIQVNVKIGFPAIVQFGKFYTATATVSPKFVGTCNFSTYFMGDIPVGSAPIKNGVATLRFKVLWPKTYNVNDQTKSISAKCNGGKYSGTGGKLFIGAGG